MSELIVCGDHHFRKEEPFFSAQKEFCKWFIKQDFNNEDNYFLELGDVFDSSSPNPDAVDLAIGFNNQLKFKKKYYLTGSHDYNRSKNSYSPTPLGQDKNTEIIYKPTRIDIGGLDCLIFPFIYDRVFTNQTQKEFYEDYGKGQIINCDYLFTHLQDETISFSKDDTSGINLSFVNGRRVQGHIHISQPGYLGTPLINNYAEKHKKCQIMIIDLETRKESFIDVPLFLDYEEIDYNNPKSSFLNRAEEFLQNERIFDILNAPSKDAAEEKFKGLYIREIKLKQDKSDDSLETLEEKEQKTLNEFFSSFCKEKNVSKKIREKVSKYLN